MVISGIRAIAGISHAAVGIAIMHQSTRDLIDYTHGNHHIQRHLYHRYVGIIPIVFQARFNSIGLHQQH